MWDLECCSKGRFCHRCGLLRNYTAAVAECSLGMPKAQSPVPTETVAQLWSERREGISAGTQPGAVPCKPGRDLGVYIQVNWKPLKGFDHGRPFSGQ